MKVYKDEGGLYKMFLGIQKVYLTEEEIAWQETLERTERETRGQKRMLDPFIGYIERKG